MLVSWRQRRRHKVCWNVLPWTWGQLSPHVEFWLFRHTDHLTGMTGVTKHFCVLVTSWLPDFGTKSALHGHYSWRSCARCMTWSHKLEGMTIRFPRSTNFPITESSFLTSRYRLFSSLCHISVCTHFLTFDRLVCIWGTIDLSGRQGLWSWISCNESDILFCLRTKVCTCFASCKTRQGICNVFFPRYVSDSKTIRLESQHPTIDLRTGLWLLRVDELQGLVIC